MGIAEQNMLGVAAGMANDVVGWVMLAVFTGFAAEGEVSITAVLRTVLGLAAFLAFANFMGAGWLERLRGMMVQFIGSPGPIHISVTTVNSPAVFAIAVW